MIELVPGPGVLGQGAVSHSTQGWTKYHWAAYNTLYSVQCILYTSNIQIIKGHTTDKAFTDKPALGQILLSVDRDWTPLHSV